MSRNTGKGRMMFDAPALFLAKKKSFTKLLFIAAFALVALHLYNFLQRYPTESLVSLLLSPIHSEEIILFLLLALFIYLFSVINAALDETLKHDAKTRNVIDRTVDGVIVVDEKGIIRYANPAAADLYKVDSSALIGRSFGQPISEEEMTWITLVDHKGNPLYAELRAGSIIWEERPGWILTIRDETERRLAKLKLSESEKLFREVLENVSMIAIQLDRKGRVSFCNDYFLKVAGYERNQVIGQDWFRTFLPEEGEGEIRELFHGVLEDREGTRHHTNAMVTRSGKKRTILWNNTPIHNEKGEAIGLISLGVDVTEEIEAREALMNSEERYRSLFGNMINGFAYHKVVTDDEGNPVDYLFLDVNSATEELTGLSKEQLIGKRVTEAIPGIESDSTDWIGIFGQVALTGVSQKFYSYSEPLRRYYNVSAYSHKKGYFAAVYEDVSDRIRSEQLLQWELKLDAALARLAHDILSRYENDLEPLLGNFLSVAKELTESPHGFVGYLSEREGTLKTTSPVDELFHLDRLDIGSGADERGGGLLGWVVERGEGLYSNDPQNDPRSSAAPEEGPVAKRLIAAPAKIGARLVGLIGLADGAEGYNERDLEVVTRLADMFALAVDRWQTRERLLNSEAFMRNLMNTIPRAIAYRDLAGRFVQVNAACARLIGKPPEEIVGKGWGDFLSVEEATQTTRHDLAIGEGAAGESISYEAKCTIGGGETRDMMVTKAPLRDASEKPVGIISVHLDITDSKRTDAALRESAERFRAIAEYAQMGIVHVDDEGTILYWNHAAETILQYPEEYALGRRFYNLYATEAMRTLLKEQMAELRKTGGGVPQSREPLIMEAIRRDGAKRKLEMSLARFKEKGRWNVVGIFQDITDRIEKDRMLQELYFAVEQSNDAVLLTSPEGVVEYCNRRFVDLIGSGDESVLGRRLTDILFSDEPSGEIVEFVRAFNEGIPCLIEVSGAPFRGVQSDRWFICSVEPIKDGEAVLTGAHVTIADITERKRWNLTLEESNEKLLDTIGRLNDTREQLIRSEKLASLGQLSAGVAHEIKNPLNIISMNAQLARGAEGIPDEMARTLDTIESQIARAVKITDNLREFARERKPEVVPFDLKAFLEMTIALVEYEMNVENLRFERAFGDEEVIIRGDPDQLAQVFLNLISNARDAMNEKQERTSYDDLIAEGWEGVLTIRLIREIDTVRIDFIDRGVGVKESEVDKVFDPFFTTKGEGKGTGLGLSVAYGIIENHGGTMEVHSTRGASTTFTIHLPWGEEASETEEKE